MRSDFTTLAAQSLDKAMPLPALLTVGLTVAMAERLWLAATLGVLFLVVNIVLNVASQKPANREREWLHGGALRLALSLALLPPLIWAAGSSALGWIVAIPALFALAFFFNTHKTRALIPSALLIVACSAAHALGGGFDRSSLYGLFTLTAVTALFDPMVTALRLNNDERTHTLAELQAATEAAERARLEAEGARAKAEASNLAKSEFLANMSHEIRTPMNAVIGMTGLLLDTELDPEQHEFVDTVRGSGEVLLALINDILDFSKIEAGEIELEHCAYDLRDCLSSALELVVERAAEKRLELLCSVAAGTPEIVLGDVTRVRQVLTNLLGNAVKFTADGEIVLCVSVDESSARTAEVCSVRFSVSDTGIGIPADRLTQLFESFSQVDASTTRKYGGTGLGLAISKRLVEQMGGELSVASELGRGSTFSFSLELGVDAKTRADFLLEEQPELEGKRLLVVDDNSTNREILRRQASGWGMDVVTLASGSEAIECVQREPRFDIAIIDMQMPEMDGVTLSKRLRELDGSIPLVMLTSVGWRPSDRRESLFAAFLTKPVKSAVMHRKLLSIFSSEAEVGAQSEGEAVETLSELASSAPLRLLVAEDNLVNQRVAVLTLESLGYRPDLAASGIEALQALRRQVYDAVLMDVQMPHMDGLEATRQIRATLPDDRQPYIIAITANVTVQDQEQCKEAGMDDYIAKPFRTAELSAALRRAAAHGSAA